jgi:hypothetical protein
MREINSLALESSSGPSDIEGHVPVLPQLFSSGSGHREHTGYVNYKVGGRIRGALLFRRAEIDRKKDPLLVGWLPWCQGSLHNHKAQPAHSRAKSWSLSKRQHAV